MLFEKYVASGLVDIEWSGVGFARTCIRSCEEEVYVFQIVYIPVPPYAFCQRFETPCSLLVIEFHRRD